MGRYTSVHGLEFTAAHEAAVGAYDGAVEAYLAFDRATGDRLKEVLVADPEMPMAHVLKGYFYHLMALPALKRKTGAIAQQAALAMGAATAREQAHLRALEAWNADDFQGAVAAWEHILTGHPRDLLALKLAHFGHFYLGDARNLRDVVARVLWAWDEVAPGHAHVLAMYAFGLEEARDFERAERMGREAVDIDPNEAWAVHAVAHVMEMQDRAREGIEWITRHEPQWQTRNNFRYHLVWHRALMHLGLGETDEVVAIYDRDLWDAQSSEYLDLCNDVALLLRLELAGRDVADRYRAIAEKVRAQCDEPALSFIDAHYVAALAAGGEAGEAERFVSDRVARGRGYGNADAGALWHAIADGLLAWRGRDFARATDRLLPVRAQTVRLGGSHAQRDLFDLILTDAAMRCGKTVLARNLLSERVAARPDNRWGWLQYAAIARGMGDAIAADRARDRVAALDARH